MSVRIRPILMLASALAGLAAGVAHATDVTTCSTEIGQVKQAIDAATFFGQNATSNESNLLAKVNSATAKLGQNKPADAIDNLMSVSDKATDLATAPKPKLDDASAINTAVTGAIACIGTAT